MLMKTRKASKWMEKEFKLNPLWLALQHASGAKVANATLEKRLRGPAAFA